MANVRRHGHERGKGEAYELISLGRGDCGRRQFLIFSTQKGSKREGQNKSVFFGRKMGPENSLSFHLKERKKNWPVLHEGLTGLGD